MPVNENIAKVSALIPTYNRRHYVLRAIDSVLAQTVPVDEIIVVDDGSTDGTADAIRTRYGGRVRLIRQANTGISGARLRAVGDARGEWVAFLDSDDEWVPDRQRQLLAAASHLSSDVAWLFGDLQIITDRGERTTFFRRHGLTVVSEPQIFEDSFHIQFPFQFPMLQGSLIRRNALLDASCFKEGLRSDEDLLAGYQIACRYKFAAINSIVTKFYRTSDLSETSLQHNHGNGPDYFRSRMMAYSLAIKKSGMAQPWAEQYAHVARGLCKLQIARGRGARRLALEQFRYEITSKSIVFWFAVLFGHTGARVWNALADSLRRRGREQSNLRSRFTVDPSHD